MKIQRAVFALILGVFLPASAHSAGDPEQTTETAPAPVLTAFDQGRVEAKMGNWDKAAALFTKAVDKDGQSYKALNMLGFTLRKIGKLDDALTAYNSALSIKPDYPQALEYRGKAHLKIGNRNAARADYQALVKLGSPLAEDLKEAIERAAKN